MHLVVRMKSCVNDCVNNGIDHCLTPGQSLCEGGLNVGLTGFESYRDCQMQPPRGNTDECAALSVCGSRTVLGPPPMATEEETLY